jgi:hypothetical protein
MRCAVLALTVVTLVPVPGPTARSVPVLVAALQVSGAAQSAAQASDATKIIVQAPPPTGLTSAAAWVGRTEQMEAHLKNAEIVSIQDIGTGVTRPRRAHLKPTDPFESLVWKVLPPGRKSGYWESYKSEVAAYELDKLLGMNMVPPAIERMINGEQGAAIMWIRAVRSVKQSGGKLPEGVVWGPAIRKMLMFDNFIGNPDRNAGNILIGPPGEFLLIDHSRAFLKDKDLPNKVERVDAALWDRFQAVTRDDLVRVLSPWIETDAIDAMLERRTRMAATLDKLIAKKGKALVVINQ